MEWQYDSAQTAQLEHLTVEQPWQHYLALLQMLAQLIVQHSHVQRWLMKIDDEHLGRGHAYLDVAVLPAIATALQLYAATIATAAGTCHHLLLLS